MKSSIPTDQMPLDIVEPTDVQIVIRDDGRTVWVNVEGRCVCRVGRIPAGNLFIEDMREEQKNG